MWKKDDTLSTKIHLFGQEEGRAIIITFYYLAWKNAIKGHCRLMLNVFSGSKTLQKVPKGHAMLCFRCISTVGSGNENSSGVTQ